MKSVELFAIPVYLCSQTDFDKKYMSRYILSHINTHSPADLEESLKQSYYPKNIWRFNQVIGYIVVSLEKYSEDHYDVVLEKWLTRANRTSITSRKDRITPTANIGDHFTVTNWDSELLATMIKKYAENDNLYKKRYIDYSGFDIFMQIVDFNQLKDIFR